MHGAAPVGVDALVTLLDLVCFIWVRDARFVFFSPLPLRHARTLGFACQRGGV